MIGNVGILFFNNSVFYKDIYQHWCGYVAKITKKTNMISIGKNSMIARPKSFGVESAGDVGVIG